MNALLAFAPRIGNTRMLMKSSINITEEYYRELKKILKIYKVKNFPFVRVGNEYDGGYIMVDNFTPPPPTMEAIKK